ncbi:hypothetical protein JZ751_007967 [Albula glossodonta]|uniref:Rho GTPase-activating protein 19 n=1 Tax=Albula glossodonta TaxID=121402 RepID=A0A8T2P1F0_9TELE|nr:hypothetical protein JZ751_007967 [Albula glossodonta]
MAADKENDGNQQNRRGTVCNVVISQEVCPRGRQPIIFNPDFFVEKLRHEKLDVFTELVLSNITRLIDLPGTEFAQLLGEIDPKVPNSGGFFRNFLKRKDKGVIFGVPLSEEGIAQIYQLIDFLSKNLHVEGLFRVPGNSVRQQALKEVLNNGGDVDLEAGGYHPNDAATLLKTFLGELPEPLLTHRHYHAHLKITELTLFDEKGNKTAVPDKERQIEALQLLFLLLPATNRTLLKLLLDLLYQTAKQQDKNKMSAFNLALMFAPHVVWPKNMTASDLQENLKKLNNCMAFLIKHSQKLFRDDLDLLSAGETGEAVPVKRFCQDPSTQPHTEEALKELFRHVNNNMPDSAKKKKLIRQFTKQSTPGTPVYEGQTPPSKKHARSRSFGGLIKRKVLRNEIAMEKRSRIVSPEEAKSSEKRGKENRSPEGVSSSLTRACFSPAQESVI